MSLVALSIAVLLAAPLLAAALLRRPALAAGLDGFVLVAVGGIVALHVVPQSAHIAGAAAIAFAAAGLFLPIALHRLDDAVLARGSARRLRDAALLTVFLAGVVVHALFDGAALAPQGDEAGGLVVNALALGVILHRVPVGIALWVVARPKLGVPLTLLVVATYAGGTIAGALLGPGLLLHASAPALAIFQAFVAGSILHIVAESPALPLPRPRATPFLLRDTRLRTPPPKPLVRTSGLIGSALAVAALWAMERAHDVGDGGHGEHAPGFLDAFVRLSLLAAPAVALSFLVVGVLFVIYPDRLPARRQRSAVLVDAARGALAGLPHPLCSCAVAPLYDELVDEGAPAASARAFLVAAPSLGVPAIFLSARLLGLPFTAARVVGAALVAVAAGVSALASRATPSPPSLLDDTATTAPSGLPSDTRASLSSAPSPTLLARVLPGLRHGVVDAVDHIGPWLLLGTAIAAAIEVSLDAHALASVAPAAQIGVAALASLPLYLCAAGATPVAFVLLGKGASTGAVLALLLVGPTTSLPTLGLVRRRHGSAAALALAGAVVAAAALVGIAADALAPSLAPSLVSDAVAPAAGPLHPSLLEIAAVVVVALLLAASFVRQGVRGFLVQVMSPQHAHAGDDVHGPNCAHEHGPAVAPPRARVTLPFDPRGSP